MAKYSHENDTATESRSGRGNRKGHTMTTRAQREFLKVQLIDTQRLRELAGQHPLMSIALMERERELTEKIAALPLDNKNAEGISPPRT